MRGRRLRGCKRRRSHGSFWRSGGGPHHGCSHPHGGNGGVLVATAESADKQALTRKRTTVTAVVMGLATDLVAEG